MLCTTVTCYYTAIFLILLHYLLYDFAVPVFFCYPGMSLLDCLCREGGVGGQGGRCPRLVDVCRF